MTAARQTLSVEIVFARLVAGVREAVRFGLKAMLALAIVFMAGVFAVITAAVGIMVAAVAVLLKLTGNRRRSSGTAHTYRAETDESGITLEAHRTARGWTVE